MGRSNAEPFLRMVRRRQVDGDAPEGNEKPALTNASADPLPAFLHRALRRPDVEKDGRPVGDVDLDVTGYASIPSTAAERMRRASPEPKVRQKSRQGTRVRRRDRILHVFWLRHGECP